MRDILAELLEIETPKEMNKFLNDLTEEEIKELKDKKIEDHINAELFRKIWKPVFNMFVNSGRV